MQKIFIKNRKNQNLAVVVEETVRAKGLAFVMHGLGGFKEQSHIQTFVKAFKKENFSVVYFDTTNTFGESDGNYEDATTTNYFEDLEDVIDWAKTQSWYQEPFWLCGHSLGGMCTLLYAQKHFDKVAALAPISTAVSKKLSLETETKESLAKWERTGIQERESASKPGLIKRLKWSYMQDALKYDVLPGAHKLAMPVLLIVGEQDNRTLPAHQKILFDALPGPKEFHVIKGAPHTFREPAHLAQIEKILRAWIQRIG